jgi:hypothetical protein
MKAKIKIKLPTKALTETFYGAEPIFKGTISTRGSSQLSKLLNWYSYASDDSQAEKYIKDYLKATIPDKKASTNLTTMLLSTVKDQEKRTLGALCRIEMNGTVFDGELNNLIKNKIDKIILYTTHDKKVQDTPEDVNSKVISIRDRIKNIADNYIIEIEDEIEKCIRNPKTITEFSMYSYLQKNEINTQVCGFIRQFIIPIIEELEEAKKGEDEELNEAYGYLLEKNGKRIKESLQFLNSLVSDLDRYASNAKTTKPRKVRTKKTVPVEKQINKLSYQKEFQQLKIKSIDPSQIIGAHQLWVFNTKYNYLTVYNTDNSAGFKLKGTTLLNVDEKTSIRKKIRKPKQVIDSVLEGGKIVLRKLMSDLTTKTLSLNNRINESTVLLRALR